MKKAGSPGRGRNLLPEYDFSYGARGKYARRYAKGANLVLLDPDVAQFFSDSRSVNKALRGLLPSPRGKGTKKAAHA